MNLVTCGRYLVAAATFGLAAPAAAQDVRSGQRVAVTERTVHIYNAVGRVTLRRGEGPLAITATSRGGDGEQLRYALDRSGDSAVFRVQFPDVDAIALPQGVTGQHTELYLRRDGTFGGGDDGWRWGRRDRGDNVEIGRRGFAGWSEIEITVPEGRDLSVHLAVGEATIDGVAGNVVIDTWSADAHATNISGSWLFDAGSGNVEVRGAQGTLRIDTGSGNGTVAGMRGDLLDFDAGSGELDATDVEVDRFRFDTGSGNVRARNLRARRGVADTGSGDVVLEYTAGGVDDLLIDTGSGSVVLTIPGTADARVVIDTGSGDVQVDRSGGIFERRGDDGVVLRFGEGRGRVRIDTGSGDVTIR